MERASEGGWVARPRRNVGRHGGHFSAAVLGAGGQPSGRSTWTTPGQQTEARREVGTRATPKTKEDMYKSNNFYINLI